MMQVSAVTQPLNTPPTIPSSSVRHVEHESELSVVFEPDVNIVVLKRPLPVEIATGTEALLAEPSLRCRVVVEANAPLLETFQREFPQAPALAADIATWCELLMDATGAPRAGVRLERVEAAMCPRFHTDQVTLRLVTTYVGQGTEYVDSHAADRRFLARHDLTLDEAHAGLLRSSDAVQACQVGDVVLLKGDAWPGNEGQGAVHRSPHACASEPRIVMTIDALA